METCFAAMFVPKDDSTTRSCLHTISPQLHNSIIHTWSVKRKEYFPLALKLILYFFLSLVTNSHSRHDNKVSNTYNDWFMKLRQIWCLDQGRCLKFWCFDFTIFCLKHVKYLKSQIKFRFYDSKQIHSLKFMMI